MSPLTNQEQYSKTHRSRNRYRNILGR